MFETGNYKCGSASLHIGILLTFRRHNVPLRFPPTSAATIQAPCLKPDFTSYPECLCHCIDPDFGEIPNIWTLEEDLEILEIESREFGATLCDSKCRGTSPQRVIPMSILKPVLTSLPPLQPSMTDTCSVDGFSVFKIYAARRLWIRAGKPPGAIAFEKKDRPSNVLVLDLEISRRCRTANARPLAGNLIGLRSTCITCGTGHPDCEQNGRLERADESQTFRHRQDSLYMMVAMI